MFNVLFKFVHIQVCNFSTVIKATISTHFSGETIAYSSRKMGPVINCLNVMSLLFCREVSKVFRFEDAHVREALVVIQNLCLRGLVLPAGLHVVQEEFVP